MSRVTGLGGIFFKAKDPDSLRNWYSKHLELPLEDWGGMTFRWRETDQPEREGATAWSLFPASSKYFDPSTSPFMINYRVANLAQVLEQLRSEGCQVDDKVDESEFGKFGWVMDPEGNRIELWEPPPGKSAG
jgi:predicted enzyme related to lactoylglutathione lyase